MRFEPAQEVEKCSAVSRSGDRTSPTRLKQTPARSRRRLAQRELVTERDIDFGGLDGGVTGGFVAAWAGAAGGSTTVVLGLAAGACGATKWGGVDFAFAAALA